MGAAGLVALGLVWLTNGTLVLQKILAALVAPCTVVWLGLTLVCYFAWVTRQRLLLFIALTAWSLFTLASNSLVSETLTRSLEDGYFEQHPLLDDGQFDLVVVLGGGTFLGRNGDIQLNDSGDRIVMAARMYHAGKTAKIVCTGTKIVELSADAALDPGVEAQAFLHSLAVPDTAVEIIPGRNTREEMESLARLVADRPGLRVGIVTSAWHLPRAMRLAHSLGMAVEPVPTDYRTGFGKITVRSFVPSALALDRTGQALNEYLARVVGR